MRSRRGVLCNMRVMWRDGRFACSWSILLSRDDGGRRGWSRLPFARSCQNCPVALIGTLPLTHTWSNCAVGWIGSLSPHHPQRWLRSTRGIRTPLVTLWTLSSSHRRGGRKSKTMKARRSAGHVLGWPCCVISAGLTSTRTHS